MTGLTVLVVEQNAHIALQLAQTAYVLEVGRVALVGPEQRAAGARVGAHGATWATDGRARPPKLDSPMRRRRRRRLAAGAPGLVGRRASSCSSAALVEHHLRPADRRRPRARRRLRQPRARARAHLPRDRGDQLRAGRDGDGLGVRRLPADPVGLLLLGGVLRHARRRVRPRHRHPARADPAGAAQVGDRRRDRHRRALHPDRRRRQLDLGRRHQVHAGAVRQQRSTTSAASPIARQDLGTIVVTSSRSSLLWVLFQFTKLGLAMRAAALRPASARARRRPRRTRCSRSAGVSPPCSAPSPG